MKNLTALIIEIITFIIFTAIGIWVIDRFDIFSNVVVTGVAGALVGRVLSEIVAWCFRNRKDD